MSTRHLVDPELLPSLDSRPRLELTLDTLPAIRRAFGEGAPREAPGAAGVTREEVLVPPGRGEAASVRALVYRPSTQRGGARAPAVLHARGGGYVVGTPELSDARNRHLAADLGCVVVSVAYRLAPETPFPGPVEDCYAALRWLHAHARVGRSRPKTGVPWRRDRLEIAARLGLGIAAGLRGKAAPHSRLIGI